MAAASQAGRRILLVDDDFTTCEAMSMILAADGYRVAVAANGADALERLRGFERPDLILLDLRMPVMDGHAFCAKRREDSQLQLIPVVVLSGLPDAEEQAVKLEATAFLRKPIDVTAMLATVRACCEAAEQAAAGAPEPA
jgi:CheY-like chemotaxis protein